jgi:energy-coupling factor transporter ATP-binding protein EcfA2
VGEGGNTTPERSPRPTIGNTLKALEEQSFAGRQEELATFREWLGAESSSAAILNVVGPGGIGKSTLLDAFAGVAARDGRFAVVADGGTFRATPEAFLEVLGGGPTQQATARLNDAETVLLIDTFEEIADLEPYLQHRFLPQLTIHVKVVIAGRYSLGSNWGSWLRVIRPMELRGLTSEQAEDYLGRRGVREEQLRAQIIWATGGHPLALSLAADIVQRFGVRDLGVAPEWRLALRALVRELLRDIRDPKLKDLLEAAAMVREFDEQTLSAVAGEEAGREAFDQLCQLSVVRPASHGLMLHEDVRSIVAADLRWRRPDRYREVRGRALEHLRDRAAMDSTERERLITERLYLIEDSFVQSLLFGADDPRLVWMEPGHGHESQDQQDAVRIARAWAAASGAPAEQLSWLSKLLEHPALRLRFARHREGRRIGFNTAIRLYRDSLPLLLDNPLLEPVISAYFSPDELAGLPDVAEESDIWYLLHSAHSAARGEAAQAALLRDLLGLVGLGGTYLATVARPELKRLIGELGFQRVVSVADGRSSPRFSPEGFVLDLSIIGVEAWMDAIVGGQPVRPGLRRDQILEAVHAALLSWQDDRALAESPLTALAPGNPDRTRAEVSDAVRRLLLRALERARAASQAEQSAYRALDLAYLQRSLSHERAAERMNVSRSTFYRLLKRGAKGIAQELGSDQ